MGEVEYLPVCAIDELPDGERLFLEMDDKTIVLFSVGGKYHAIEDRCTHDNGPLGEGDLEGCDIICPRHGARFDIRTGKVLTLPAVQGVKSYPVRIAAGFIEIGFEA